MNTTSIVAGAAYSEDDIDSANDAGVQVGNRPPTPEEMSFCLPFLRAQLEIVQPELIVALGATAAGGLGTITALTQPSPAALAAELQRRADEDGQLTNTSTKLVRIDKRPARALDLVGQLRVVLFTPSDVELVTGPPSERRRYLDITLSQLDPHYVRTLAHYQKILQQRNSLLRSWRERRTPNSTTCL